ncbi:AsnC family transcriptional regulator, partial [Glaciimonas sp. Cout2]
MADNDAEAVLPDDGLDAIDRTLIVALQTDGPMTYAELGAQVGLSAG